MTHENTTVETEAEATFGLNAREAAIAIELETEETWLVRALLRQMVSAERSGRRSFGIAKGILQKIGQAEIAAVEQKIGRALGGKDSNR